MEDFLIKHRIKIQELRKLDINEANTKSNLIDPLLKALGWDIHNFIEVEKEKKVLSGIFVDYALKINDISLIYIEAKKINDDLSNIKDISQAIRYANDDGIEWLILTNGDRINLYKTREQGDLTNKLILEIIISDEYYIEFLDYFKKENVEKNILNNELNKLIITKRVIRILEKLFSDIPEELLEFLIKRYPFMNEDDFKEGFNNIDITFDNLILPRIEESIDNEPNSIIESSIGSEKYNQIMEVLELILNFNKSFSESVKIVALKKNIFVGTVRDKCTRQIKMNTAQFKNMLMDRVKLINFLINEFPEKEEDIKKRLKNKI